MQISSEMVQWLTWAAGAGAALVAAGRAKQRLELSLAKHPSLGGHLRMAKRMAHWLPAYTYDESTWFAADGAPQTVSEQRKTALARLGTQLRESSPLTIAHTDATRSMVSDMQLISQIRVPYQFREVLYRYVNTGNFWQSSEGVWLTDMDGKRHIDVTGSYGVNLFGLDFYKDCIRKGSAMAETLGPTLGAYHPVVRDNVERLCRISGQQEVSFHMSGTEAVMQAVRMARYHSGKRKIVRFTGSYHGWWDDVQPGPGNPMPPSGDTLTLNEMHANTLRVLRNRNDIACVLINPLQALHPNRAAPTDATLIDGGRNIGYDKEAYRQWLHTLREVCTEKGIALILDEVFLGFRLAYGGAQEYFGVRADMVTYGKTLGGGLPVGVVCGQSRWMKRFGDERPGNVCFARGTFNAHPYVMCAMNVFLHYIETPEVQAVYAHASTTWNGRQAKLNQRLQEAGVPVRVRGMESVWAVVFEQPGRYHWLLQYYLREHGVALSWVGSGRMIFSFNFDDQTFDMFCERFVAATLAMQADAWWWTDAVMSHRGIRRQVLKEMLQQRWPLIGDLVR